MIDTSKMLNEGHKIDSIKIGSEWFVGIGYQGLLNVNTKTYVDEPNRTNDGSMPNINDHDTFIVPRCKVNFKYFRIEDYQRLCRVITSANEFPVTFWDKQFGEWVTHNMYVEPEDMYKMFNVGTSVFRVLDYEISFIGTLNDLKKYKISYDAGQIEGQVPTIKNYQGEYFANSTYKKDDVVSQDKRYYVAVYYVDTFKDKPLTNTEYWESKSVRQYSSTTSYKKGDIVYISNTDSNNKTTYKFYVATDDNTDRPVTNTIYWQQFTPTQYNPNTTYSKGKYVYETQNSALTRLYLSVYYLDTFTGKDVSDTQYWALTSIYSSTSNYGGIEVNWGKSVIIEEVTNLFTLPQITGLSFIGWKTRNGIWYQPNQNANVFNDMNLVAQWEIKPSNN